MSNFSWRRPFASAYFRSAGSYLGLKLVIFSLAGLASQFLLTRYLVKEDYGLIIWVATIIGLLSPFGLPGISTSITGAVAKGYDGNFRRGTWYEIIGSTFGGAVLLGISGYYYFWHNDLLRGGIFAVAGVLGPGLWLDTQQCYWNGKKNFKAIFWWSVPVRLVQLVATAIVLQVSPNPVVVFGVQTLIQVVANLAASFGIMLSGQANRELSSEYLSFGSYSTVLYFIGTFSVYFDKLVIGSYSGMKALAAFAVGELLYTYFYKTPSGILTQIFLPRQAEMPLQDAARWTQQRQKYLIAGMACICMLLAFVVPVVYPLFFTEKYSDSVFYAELFILCVFLGSPTFLSGTLIRAHALKKQATVVWLINTLSPLLFVPLFGKLMGVTGIILARGTSNFVLSIYYFYMINCCKKQKKVLH